MAAIALPTYETKVFTELPKHVTLDEAAALLDKTPARVRQMIGNKNFRKVWELGDRPTYLLDRREVEAMAEEGQA